MQPAFITPGKLLLALAILVGALLLFSRLIGLGSIDLNFPGDNPSASSKDNDPASQTYFTPPTRQPGDPLQSPTPDAPHPLPTLRSQADEYVVQPGDNLNQIARRYAVSVDNIVQANDLGSPDYIEPGQPLTIPAPTPEGSGPDFKIIPDSELVNGPLGAAFSVADFVKAQGGYLADYEEELEGRTVSGVKIVERIAQEYSVNPRLLLAVLEYQSGWVTHDKPPKEKRDYPIGIRQEFRKGIYRQLAWAADNLNRGYYLWRVNGLGAWNLADGGVLPAAATINAGTAGIQHFFAQLLDRAEWERAVSEQGLFATYYQFFGYPFDLSVEPLFPPGLAQPPMQLPFEPGDDWAYTGGPHGGWGSGSAWAALDFAPPGEALGCVESDAWVVAVADGVIVRAGNGAVVQDLDGDGIEQTGWTVLYMHIESRERVKPGVFLRAGGRIGHPSCEGGISTGTHVHLARRYNGEWIPADQDLPFVMDGWVSVGLGNEYDGYLERNGETVEAWEGRIPENAIGR